MITIFDGNGPWEIWKHGKFLYITDDKSHAMEMDTKGYVVALHTKQPGLFVSANTTRN